MQHDVQQGSEFSSQDVIARMRPGRKICGMSAVLLPHDSAGRVDWPGFESHLSRTAACGLIPAVNMDTGFLNLLTDDQRLEVLARTKSLLSGAPFVAGAWVRDAPGAAFDLGGYCQRCEEITSAGGRPVVVQSFGLTELGEDQVVGAYRSIGERCGEYFGFELGTMFAPFGRIYSTDVYAQLVLDSHCQGAKHSSLNREAEWERLAVRDRLRPEFRVLTGNDLAIDMVMYGSDYLLGLSSFAPDWFALRDRMWEQQDHRFWELNDVLQYLGAFSFRSPVPAYKHSAAMFLHLRGWLPSPTTHPKSPTRPESDQQILGTLWEQLQSFPFRPDLPPE